MNLLPKTQDEFSKKEYWDAFFKQRGKEAFEWYGEYPELCEHLHKYIKPKDDVLITGCGNSTLGGDLYNVGYNKITNIDISSVVIKQMSAQHAVERPDLKFLQMDAFNMSFSPDTFSVVLDKGTLDALMSEDDTDNTEKIQTYFTEIIRVLKVGGRYMCISLLQEHILKALLDYFTENCMFRIVRCIEAENANDNSLPVFLVICTKFKSLPRKILEVNLGGSMNKVQRFESVEEIIREITNVQNAAFICSGLKNTSLSQESEVCLDLFKPGELTPRFTVYVVNGKLDRHHSQYAAFIVPQGRESEWLFSTQAGRQNLVKMTKVNRLAMVTLHRGQQFGTLDELQQELSDAVCNLAPGDLKNKKIPFLSLGSDVGKRTIRLTGNSQLSGDYVVEDVEIDQEKYRRLFYLNSQLVIQSEARLKTVKTKKGPKEIVDLNHITCKHHIYMSIATLLACRNRNSPVITVVGLGGGGLCSFLHKLLPKCSIAGVDIDEEMRKVAREWFGLVENQHLTVVIDDGLNYLQEKVRQKQKFQAILFDVDSKDNSLGMSCPPKQFLQDSTLNNIMELLEDGFFVLNLVLRNFNLKPGIVASLKSKFGTVISYKLEEDLNEILMCSKRKLDVESTKQQLQEAALVMNSFFKSTNSNTDDHIDTVDFLTKIKFL